MSTIHIPLAREGAAPEAAQVPDALAKAIDASLSLAMKYHHAGELEHAETLYRGILETLPEHAAANFFLGRLAVRVGQAQVALPHFVAALKAQPSDIDYRLGYIDALIWADQFDDAQAEMTMVSGRNAGGAEPSIRAALSTLAENLRVRSQIARTLRDTQLRSPATVSTTSSRDMGMAKPSVKEINKLAALYKQRRHAEAETLGRSLTTRFPKHGYAWKVLGASQLAQGRLVEALDAMEISARCMPSDAESHLNIARILDALGRFTLVESAFRTALELNPNDAAVHQELAAFLERQGRLPEAELHCLRAIEIDPSRPDSNWTLGSILKEMKRPKEAEEIYRKTLETDGNRAYGPTLLGMLLSEQERWTEAEAAFRQATAAEPSLRECYGNLGLALSAQGRQAEANDCFREAVRDTVNNSPAYTAMLFNLTLSPTMGPTALFTEHCKFGTIYEAPVRPTWQPHDNVRDPDRPLHIGFVSADFYNHAVSTFFEPVLQHLSASPELVITAYSNRSSRADDATTHRLRSQVTHWHCVDTLTAAELANKVRADGIDILVDLSGHTMGNRLMAFVRKPAPIQVSWMGYPGTTGLVSMDYYLCDRFILPPGQFDDQFTEKLVRLPANAPFRPEPQAPPVNGLPAFSAGHFTFGSFNRLNKINHDVVVAWARIMHAIPGSRMLLGSMPSGGETGYRSLIEWFATQGIDRARLDFHERTDMRRYLELHHEVDLCLDTFPYNGGTTCLHSVWMGVPTLTISGDTMTARVGAGVLGHLGLDEFAAPDVEAFVTRGAAWAERLPELAQLRSGLRSRFAESAIGQPALIAAGLESALRTMWRRWCADLHAESFDAQVAQGDRA